MINRWNEQEAEAAGDDRARCAYAARWLAAEPSSLRLTSLSLKATIQNAAGGDEEVLFINGRGRDPTALDVNDFTIVRRRPLADLAQVGAVTAAQIENELACQRTRADSPLPSADAVRHAALPDRAIIRAEVAALAAICRTPGMTAHLRRVYGEDVAALAPAASITAGARIAVEARRAGSSLQGLVTPDGELIAWGDTLPEACQRLIDLVARAEQYLRQHQAWDIALPSVTSPPIDRTRIAELRKTVSEAFGVPIILATLDHPVCLDFARRADATTLLSQARLIDQPPAQPARILLDPHRGVYAAGRTAEVAAINGGRCRREIEAVRRAEALEAARPDDVMRFTDSDEHSPDEALPFVGEVALVTGAASGIGRACVESLLRRGAAVAGLDVSPRIVEVSQRRSYLGLVCDVTDEAAVARAFDATANAFGGLDMLVLNAGVFPPGTRIEALGLDVWQTVMRVNLDANLTVLREAYPLLKRSPRGGRVLVNASKNVLAPGAGAAAYSASKAALTQLARVAALEWGKDKIRINMIHPDAVFDTGIWSEETLQARAAHYGLTVQQYKSRNVLGVELNSRYVAELAAEMLGPLFEKITGAQIAVDGGSDRVI